MPALQRLPIQIQPRDIEVLVGLLHSRIMTLAHISALYFDGKMEMTKKRMQKLKAADLVRERPRRPVDPSILFLSREGLALLQSEGHLPEIPKMGLRPLERRSQVSTSTIRHELQVANVKVAIISAAAKTNTLKVVEFSTWPTLIQFIACQPDGSRVITKPDGFLRIQESDPSGGLFEHAFFIEVDRSTETLEVLSRRAHCYLDFYRSGGFARRNNALVDEYKQFPFRVLLVCKSWSRCSNVARRLLLNNPPVRTHILLAVADDVERDPLGMIWATSHDLATMPTPSLHSLIEKSVSSSVSSHAAYVNHM